MEIKKIIFRHTSGSKTNQEETFDYSETFEISLGRSSDQSIQFDPDGDVQVSRNHTVIKRDADGNFNITDMNSTNGTYVNGQKIVATTPLHAGDSVQLGLDGPKFEFDLYPRPKVLAATQLITPIQATQEVADYDSMNKDVIPEQPAQKVGIGQETLEHELRAERKKTSFNVLAIVLGLLILGSTAFYTIGSSFYKADDKPEVHTDKGNDQAHEEEVVPIKKYTAEDIAQSNMNKVVMIEAGWKLVHATKGDDIYHLYEAVDNPQTGKKMRVPVFIKFDEGSIEPFLNVRNKISDGEPIAGFGTGTGFVIDERGNIMTNKHVSSPWAVIPYQFQDEVGLLVAIENGKIVKKGLIKPPTNWVPVNTGLFGGKPASGKVVTGDLTYLDVIFAKTSQRSKAVITRESDDHDLAIIKIELIGEIEPVVFASSDEKINEGQKIVTLGYPGISPVQAVLNRDQYTRDAQYKIIPTPTVVEGIISKVILNSQEAAVNKNKYIASTVGESYQMTINTGPGHSGGPVFNDKGEVIGILNSIRIEFSSNTKFSFCVPSKYAKRLMTTQTVIK